MQGCTASLLLDCIATLFTVQRVASAPMRFTSKTLNHNCCRTWQVFVMGPVIGDVNAGASIVKAMLVNSETMPFF